MSAELKEKIAKLEEDWNYVRARGDAQSTGVLVVGESSVNEESPVKEVTIALTKSADESGKFFDIILK